MSYLEVKQLYILLLKLSSKLGDMTPEYRACIDALSELEESHPEWV